MVTDPWKMFRGADFGDNIEEVVETEECKVLRLNDPSGDGLMTIYRVFDGVYLMYNDFHLAHCYSRFTSCANLLCIDHCREGRMEHRTEQDLHYYIEAGDMRVDRRVHHTGDVDFPLSHYHGITIGFFMEQAEKAIYEAMPTISVHQMGLRSLCNENIASVQNSVPETETMQLQNFCFSYDGTPVLNIPHLSLPLDGIIALVGPNGAGKSTFSRCLCGLEKKFKGQVRINGQLWKNRQLLKNCYMVMQDVNHQLFCETVADEVQLGMRSENSSDVERVLEMLDLSHLRERHPMSLSGGQKQRVAIASAILAGKEILIFDEPTSGLDFRHMEQTAALLSSLKGNQTVLIVTHDPELIQRCCDHIVCIENGTVI